jgi:type I restriction enzyme M protein
MLNDSLMEVRLQLPDLLTSPLPVKNSVDLIFELLAWKKLSLQNQLLESDQYQVLQKEFDISKLIEVFSKFSTRFPSRFKTGLLNRSDIIPLVKHLYTCIDYWDGEICIQDLGGLRSILQVSNSSLLNPVGLCKLLLAALDMKPGEDVYIPYIQDPSFVLGISLENEVFCETAHQDFFHWLPIYEILFGIKAECSNSDPVIQPNFQAKGTLQTFDYSAAILPINSAEKVPDQDPYFRFSNDVLGSKRKDVAILEHILVCARQKAVVIVPHSMLRTNVSTQRSFRERLVKEKKVEAVVSISERLFPHKQQTCILVIDKIKKCESILFLEAVVEAGDYENDDYADRNIQNILSYLTREKQSEVNSREVPCQKVLENRSDLSPRSYLLSDTAREAIFFINRNRNVKLSEIAAFPSKLSSNAVTSDPKYKFKVKEVNAQHLENERYVLESDLKYLDWTKLDESTDLAKFSLYPLDIVLCTKGKVGAVGLMPESLDNQWLPNQTLTTVRVNSDLVSPQYLYMFFCSKLFRSQLESLTAGTSVPTLPSAAVKDLKIPILPIQAQRRVEKAFDRIQDLLEQIRHHEHEISSLRDSFWKSEQMEAVSER